MFGNALSQVNVCSMTICQVREEMSMYDLKFMFSVKLEM